MAGLDATIRVSRGEFDLNVSLTIPPGETVALLGPNGAGKSTTIDVLSGLIALDDGAIELNAMMLDEPRSGRWVPPSQRNIGVVFQDYLLFEHLSVIDNVAFGPLMSLRKRSAARQAVEPLVKALGLDSLAGRRPSELSGGQAQRVALARALATTPGLLLLDEPLAALDVATRHELRRELAKQLSAFEGPRLLITHDPADAFLLADRIVIVEGGKVTQAGTPQDLRRRPTTTYAAAVAGTNLLVGTSRDGLVQLDEHDHVLQTSDTSLRGRVLLTVHPTAVSLHSTEPGGSPRNSWQTVVGTIEPLGDTTRITLDAPVPMAVDITPGATDALGLVPGSSVWASVKATEITASPV